MPWKELTPMSQRKEFVSLALTDGANMARLCRRFEISRKTGYKWLARYLGEGEAGLFDHCRRPRASPWVTPPEMEEAVLRVREAHPAWGGRKLGLACKPKAGRGARGQHHHRDFAPPWSDRPGRVGEA
jgi:transposase-like protein